MSASSSSSSDTWTPEDFNKNFVIKQYPKEFKTTFDQKLNMLYGTSVSMVAAAFFKALHKARKNQNCSQLLIDMVFSVFVSQTVSREWARVYSTLGPDSMFVQFEVAGNRTGDPKVPESSWVATSRMNATAVGILGHLIMECTGSKSSLGRKAAENGTIFRPARIEDFPSSEYVKICNQTNATITSSDRVALDNFRKLAGHLVGVIEELMEGSTSSVEEAAALVAGLPMKNF